MVVRDEDGTQGTRIDVDAFEAVQQLFRGESGVQQQIAFGAVNDRGIALAAAAEDGAAERAGMAGWRI